jgi:hypothetical protein
MKNISAKEILERMKRNPIQKACGKKPMQIIGNKKRKAKRLKHQQEISNE